MYCTKTTYLVFNSHHSGNTPRRKKQSSIAEFLDQFQAIIGIENYIMAPKLDKLAKSKKKKVKNVGCQTENVADYNLNFVSRFVSDYEPVRCLGQGSFGIVLQARDKLVGISYAVKRIGLTSSELAKEKVMREVNSHARLTHQHTVRYYVTWLEAPPPGWQAKADSDLARKTGSSIQDPGWTATYCDNAERELTEDAGSLLKPGDEFDLAWARLYLRQDINMDKAAAETSKKVQEESTGGIYFEQSASPDANPNGHEKVGEKKKDPPTEYLYIAMELCSGGTLQDWLGSNHMRDYADCIKLFRQICTGIAYIHKEKLIHRDLKPSNIYLSRDHGIKIGDFGLAIHPRNIEQRQGKNRSNDQLSELVGTRLYMSPEQLNQQPYDYKVDIFSLGLILLDLLIPFDSPTERLAALLFARQGHFPPLLQHMESSEIWLLLLRNMLDKSSAVRLNANQILQESPKLAHHSR